MKEFEVRTIGSPEEIKGFLDYLEAAARARRDLETKYNFQTKIKDVEFAVDEEKAEALGVNLPVTNIEQAERLLQEGIITPKKFIEQDETVHEVMEFQPEPVGHSGFDNCVIHSLAQTNVGLFEVGRYPAVDLGTQTKAWQWFIHRKIES